VALCDFLEELWKKILLILAKVFESNVVAKNKCAICL
jgi:hypothetical protein